MPQDRSPVDGDSDFLSRQQLLLANGWKLNQEKTGLKKSFTFENWTRCHVRYASDLLRLVAHIRESFADLVAVESWLEDHHALLIIVGHHYNRKKITMLTKNYSLVVMPQFSGRRTGPVSMSRNPTFIWQRLLTSWLPKSARAKARTSWIFKETERVRRDMLMPRTDGSSKAPNYLEPSTLRLILNAG